MAIEIVLPAPVADEIGDLGGDGEEKGLRGLLLEGAVFLRREGEASGSARLRAALVRAVGDELAYRVRLVQTQAQLRPLVAEVWELEEHLTGTRNPDPPADVPDILPDLRTLSLTLDHEVRRTVDTSADADLPAGDPHLALVAYGLGVRRSATLSDAEVAGRVVAASGDAAVRKFELVKAMQARQNLELRRAGLRGMLDLPSRRGA